MFSDSGKLNCDPTSSSPKNHIVLLYHVIERVPSVQGSGGNLWRPFILPATPVCRPSSTFHSPPMSLLGPAVSSWPPFQAVDPEAGRPRPQLLGGGFSVPAAAVDEPTGYRSHRSGAANAFCNGDVCVGGRAQRVMLRCRFIFF